MVFRCLDSSGSSRLVDFILATNSLSVHDLQVPGFALSRVNLVNFLPITIAVASKGSVTYGLSMVRDSWRLYAWHCHTLARCSSAEMTLHFTRLGWWRTWAACLYPVGVWSCSTDSWFLCLPGFGLGGGACLWCAGFITGFSKTAGLLSPCGVGSDTKDGLAGRSDPSL